MQSWTSILVFLVLFMLAMIWTVRVRRSSRRHNELMENELRVVAQIAQRRHVLKYGKEDTGLHDTMAAGGHK